MVKKIFYRFEEILCSILVVGMCITAILQVLSRYIFRKPFSWTEEACTMMFVWVVFIGASLALKTEGHFTVEIFVEKLPHRLRQFFMILSCVTVIAFSAMLVFLGLRFAINGWQAITPALELPKTFPYSAVWAGGLLMMIRGIQNLVKILKTYKAEKVGQGA